MAGALHASASFPPIAAPERAVVPEIVRFGPYQLNLKSGDLRKFGYRIKLQPKSFLVLKALLEARGAVVTREELKAHLWPEDTFVEFESSLNVAVRRLRDALSDEAQSPVYIETVPRCGYRFIGTAEFTDVAAVPVSTKIREITAAELGRATAMHIPEAVPQSWWTSRAWPALAVAATFVFLTVTGVLLWKTPTSVRSAPLASSIAVLPFADMSADRNQNYFSDGLAEDLLNDLARTPGLRVAARTSSFQFRDKGADLAEIGKKLGVATILEGSVQKQGDRVRISAELVKAEDGFQLWSGKYDRNLNDVFAVQDEIARAITGELKVRLLRADGESVPPRATNPAAYNAYLQGRYYYERRTANDIDLAYQYFQQAVRLDPNYARGWSALAWAGIARTEEGPSFAEGYRDAMSAAQRALQLDPGLAEAHAAVGRIERSFDWDWAGANAAFQKALALEPQNSVVLLGASSLQASLGNFEAAIALNRRAVEIDPLSVTAHLSMGMHAYYGGHPAMAMDAFQKALAISPNAPAAHYLLGLVYLATSHSQQALAEFERDPVGSERTVGEALAYYALGHQPEADAALHQLLTGYRSQAAFQIAEVYAYRDEPDSAMQWLEVARAHKDAGLAAIKGDPLLKTLEGDARFTTFLQSIGLQGAEHAH
jgi:TolB-like protein/DNA-binding winged helix-turn-helix (wHTH) protein/cytochrome c-type biogenesis protein CcmH/NrfG